MNYNQIGRMNNVLKKEKVLIGFGLVFIALFVCMLSPLHPLSGDVPNTDSSVFLTIAQGILHGKLPYVDFFDHKGPLLYFIDALGLAIGGFDGVWLLEFLFMIVSVFFAYKTARFFGGKLSAFLGTAFTFVVATEFFQEGNLSEEYGMPFIFISLYIFTKYYFTRIEFSTIHVAVLGACLVCTLLLKPTLFAVWVAFCAVIFFRKISQQEYKILFRHILFFFIGLFIVLIPVLLYLKSTGSYDAFIQQYWFFNITYSSAIAGEGGLYYLLKVFFLNFNWAFNKSILPAVIGLIWLFKKPYNIQYDFYIAYILSIFFSCYLVAHGYNYLHYCMSLVPLFVPVLTFCLVWFFKWFPSAKHSCVKYGVPILIVCIFFNKLIFTSVLLIQRNIRGNERNYYLQLGQFIDTQTTSNELITVLNNNCEVYLFANRNSVSKYIYQTSIAGIDSRIADEYISDVFHGKPTLIIMPLFDDNQFSSHQKIFSPILKMIDEEYDECFKDNMYVIFKRRE
jgi:hypothetical protein